MISIIIIVLLLAASAVYGNEEGENRLLGDDDEGGRREGMGRWKCFRTIVNGDKLLDEGIGSSGKEYSGVTMLTDKNCRSFLLEILTSINPISLMVSNLG
jgi:hypothetical protein